MRKTLVGSSDEKRLERLLTEKGKKRITAFTLANVLTQMYGLGNSFDFYENPDHLTPESEDYPNYPQIS